MIPRPGTAGKTGPTGPAVRVGAGNSIGLHKFVAYSSMMEMASRAAGKRRAEWYDGSNCPGPTPAPRRRPRNPGVSFHPSPRSVYRMEEVADGPEVEYRQMHPPGELPGEQR